MTRATVVAAFAVVVLTALPATAQYGGGPPPPQPEPERPPAEQGQVEVTTPCSTIVITGDSWGPGTEIFIDRDFGSASCPGQGDAPNVSVTAPPQGQGGSSPQSFSGGSGERVVADENGRFTAEILVPADAVGDYDVTMRGTDLSGEAKYQHYVFNVTPTSSFGPSTSPVEDGGNTMIAIAALVSAVLLAVAFNRPLLSRRRR